MNKVDRSFAGRLRLVVLGLGLFTLVASPVLAAEEDHGNPGQFVENIRKGLSGISKYFWSPKGLRVEPQAPAKITVEKPAQPKVAIKKITPPKTSSGKSVSHKSMGSETATRSKVSIDTKTAAVSKVQTAKVEKVLKKAPEQNIKAASALTRSEPQGKRQTHGNSDTPEARSITGKTQRPASAISQVDPRKPAVKTVASAIKSTKKPQTVTSPQKVTKEALSNVIKQKQVTASKAHKVLKSAPRAEKPAIKRIRTTRQPQSVKPRIEQKRSQMAKAKRVRPVVTVDKKASTSSRLVDQAQIGSLKAGKAAKPVMKKQAQLLSPMKPVHSASRSMEQTLKKPQAAQKVPASKKRMSRAVAISKEKNSRKGTYIWLPNKGSPLFSRYGRSGILADRLVASGNAERKDGRWVFAPYKAGLLPGIYGLSEQIHKAGDKETWIGRGRTWLYVFDNKRTYGTFGRAEKPSRKKIAKTGKAGSLDKRRAAFKKSAGAAKKTATGPSGNRVAGLTARTKASRPRSFAQRDIKDRNSKKSDKLARAASTLRDKTVQQGRMVKNGNWVKEKGRWVYRAKGSRAQASIAKPANQLSTKGGERNRRTAQRKLKGGWVYRNNRWTYVTRSKEKRYAVHAGVSGRDKNTIVLQKRAKPATATKLTKALRARENNGTLQKDMTRLSSRKNKARRHLGLAKSDVLRSGRSQTRVMRHQKRWVRRNNRWVYAKNTPATGHQAHIIDKKKGLPERRGAYPLQGAVRQKNSSSQKKSRGHGPMIAGNKSMDNHPGRKFLFFIPGRTPGTGSWFTAPLEMLRHARKVRKPETRWKR